ncbi:MAG: tRNA (adenosine(37)-N6)-threonylcarbamoyltransferase complex dimerization subunit type 1 TsaB [Candidatus Omnitrophota bacterium]
MRILFLDTSSKYLSLGLARDGKMLAQRHSLLDRRHSARLTLNIAALLKQARLSLKDIDGFSVGKGPGSFTGLRIGITTIKGLAYIWNKPVVAIPSLDILAQGAKVLCRQKQCAYICPIVDAKQNKVYTSLYAFKNGAPKRILAYALLPFEALLARLPENVLFLGDALTLHDQQIKKSYAGEVHFAPQRYWYPRAPAGVDLSVARFSRGECDDADRLVPLYLYPKDCQIKKVVGRRE